jgi:N-acetylglutamate synthase-like GNAT family acetyltransferase
MLRTWMLFMKIDIRFATRNDEGAVSELLTASALPLDGVSEAIDDFIVATLDGHVAAVAGVERCGADWKYAVLRSVVVDDAVRNTGLGARLVKSALASARERGVTEIYLLTTTAADYFPRFGFRPITRDVVPEEVKRNVEFVSACPATAQAMVLAL